jgi:MFS family permease
MRDRTTIAKGFQMNSQPAAAEPQNLRYAWYVVFALMLCYTLSFVDRQILAFLVGPIKRDLHVTDEQVGLLGGFAFAIFYTLVGLPMGRLADKLSRRNIIAIGVVFWSFMTASGSIAKSYWTLAFSRVGVGVGEATLGPSAFSLISDYFPKEKLSSALSVYSMGILIGSGLALIVGGMVVGAVSSSPAVDLPVLGNVAAWQLTFLVVGLPGLLFALLVFTVREPKRKGLAVGSDGQTTTVDVAEALSQVFARWPVVFGVSLAMACQSIGNYTLTFWGPSFFERVHHWSKSDIGLTLGLITLSFGCLGLFVGGRLSDRWVGQGVYEGPLKVGCIAVLGVACTLAPAMLVSNVSLTIALLMPTLFFLGMPIGSAYASLQMIFPNQVRGVVSALFLFILNFIGLGLGPYVPGLLNVRVFHDDNMVGASIAITVATASVLGAILFWASFAPYRRYYAEMHGTGVSGQEP